MKRVESLISELRALTGNQRYDANSGVSQALMVRALKNAQLELYKQIVNQKTFVFSKEITTPVVNLQETYSYPTDMYLMNLLTMQWSQNPLQAGIAYINLVPATMKDRVTNENGYAFGYVLRGDGYLLCPPLASGTLRLVYTRTLPDLEKRAGQISSVTASGGNLSGLTIDPSEASFDPASLNDTQTFCVVSVTGAVKVKGLTLNNVNTTTGVMQLGSLQAYTGTISVGDYVVCGLNSTNQSEMPDICENYLLKHATYEIREGDASKWSAEALNDLKMAADSIIASYSNPQHDALPIPITDTDYLELW